MTASETEQQI